ncbi:Na+/H+ antiporter subunit E [Actinoallomurus acaciae]|uniref:Na+/H+ antiporter subunit E n=1 Tax=Actinoallomurus acaciae TaxID=502577 RepID=A0ABV5YUE7_9ACTN
MTGRPPPPARRAAVRAARAVAFLGHFTRLFLQANVTVAWEIITPGSGLAPAIVELPLRARTTLEVIVLAHLIMLIPGTLVIEARTDPPTLFVHGMHAPDPAYFIDRLHDLEDRLLAVLRPAGGGGP